VLPGIDLGGNGDLTLWMNNSPRDLSDAYFEPVVSGTKTYEVIYLEPSLNEDISNISIKAVDSHDRVTFEGTKNFISSRRQVDFLVLLASLIKNGKQEPVFYLAESGQKGILIEEDKSLPLGFKKFSVRFDNCTVPAKNRVTEQGQGLKVIEMRECLMSPLLAARTIGAAWRCIEISAEYYRSNARLSGHQAIQTMFADSATEIHAARILTYSRAQEIDDGKYDLGMSSVARVFASEASTRAIEKMIQVLGDRGFSKRMPIETLYRIARFHRIIDRPSEVYRKYIAYKLMNRDLW
jgi:alkylation response protein AidB-like acyl-CoA dehydrogenase